MSRQSNQTEAPTGTHTWLVLWKAYNAVRDYAARDIESLGLSLTDFGIMEALLHKGPLPVNELGRKVALTSGSISTAVDRLQERGLVQRRSTGNDGRARIVHLTPKGRKEIDCAFTRHAANMDDLGHVLTDEEREHLVALLKTLGLAAANSKRPPVVTRMAD